MESGSITSWQIDRETMETLTDFILEGFKITAKAFDCVDHNKLWKILQEMGIPDHLTRVLRNLYAGQEATVSKNWTWNNRLVPNWERSASKLYIVTLLI